MKRLEDLIGEIGEEDKAEFLDDPAEVEKLRQQVRMNASPRKVASKRRIFANRWNWIGVSLACIALVMAILPASKLFGEKPPTFFGSGDITTAACTEEEFWQELPEDNLLPKDYLSALTLRKGARLSVEENFVGLSLTKSRVNEAASLILGMEIQESCEITVIWDEKVNYKENLLEISVERTEYGRKIMSKDNTEANYCMSFRSFREGNLTYYIYTDAFILPGESLPQGTLFADEVLAAMFD